MRTAPLLSLSSLSSHIKINRKKRWDRNRKRRRRRRGTSISGHKPELPVFRSSVITRREKGGFLYLIYYYYFWFFLLPLRRRRLLLLLLFVVVVVSFPVFIYFFKCSLLRLSSLGFLSCRVVMSWFTSEFCWPRHEDGDVGWVGAGRDASAAISRAFSQPMNRSQLFHGLEWFFDSTVAGFSPDNYRGQVRANNEFKTGILTWILFFFFFFYFFYFFCFCFSLSFFKWKEDQSRSRSRFPSCGPSISQSGTNKIRQKKNIYIEGINPHETEQKITNDKRLEKKNVLRLIAV